MRELKYRAWDPEEKKMYDVQSIDFARQQFSVDHDLSSYSFGVIPTMQSTGVTDCNGLDIYESDIVRITHTALLIPANTIGVVSYVSARYVIDTHAHTHGLNMFVDRRFRRYGKPHIEVIGNVWEHPELAPKK